MCDHPAIYEETTRKAAKAHRCCECRRTIEKGDAYHEVRGLWDGQWGTYRTCARCERVRNALLREMEPEDRECGFVFGGMREKLRERIYDRHRWAKKWKRLARGEEGA